eukprot:CAMPEP_0116129810 /NCGR_PEP_ID=MMETSP0329-20121206/8118_1 /TAXON_ID=697910 /ORGANISM="Pseudo-nitzschia arenysensis, Strain B593" /LENGTH=701 /DNA_ID=CAMNT_0003624093 /DNA_START=71 /DNA_END=2176 /DNA_ORIENTATION=+
MGLSTEQNTKNAATVGEQRRRGSLEYSVYSIAVVAIFVFYWVVSSGEMLETNFSEDSENMNIRSAVPKYSTASKEANTICSNVCTVRRQKRNGYLLDNAQLFQQATSAKERLLNKLKVDYGEYFEPIFVDTQSGRYRPFNPSSDISMERLKRKLKIKILSMQKNLKSQDSDFHGCDCSYGRDTTFRAKDVLEKLDTEDETLLLEGIEEGTHYEKYVWSTGGHSAAAAHGNLYNESYTAYMDSDLKDIFGSIGIEFEGRNFAMGGTSSGTIVSMCWKEIFGQDIDFFSWDYGMTDGSNHFLSFHYAFRGAMSPTRPAFMMVHNGGRSKNARLGALRILEQHGLPLFDMNDNHQNEMRENFPDSAGISSEAISALPEYVRNYKCGTSIEKGEPFCRKEKYSSWVCSKRSKQASWHPGFKDHALTGHGLALFLMEALLDALSELKEEGGDDHFLEVLTAEDIAIHKNLTTEALPDAYRKVVTLEEVHSEMSKTNETSIDERMFTIGPSLCHTARLPSQSRYKGLLVNDTELVGKQAPAGEEKYYVGDAIWEAHKSASKTNEIRIVYDANDREAKCKGIIKPDYADSFYVNSLDDWASMKFPNHAEKEFFEYDSSQYQGLIVFHLKKCDWGKCPSKFLTIEDYNEHWEMKVNKQRISKVISIDTATLAMGENGFRIEPDENGQYEIEIKVKTADKYLEFADFVLW